MRALRYHGPHDIRLSHETPRPDPQPGQVLVRPAWCGLCGSDLHAWTSGASLSAFRDAPHPVTGESWPVTLGHEFSGEVVDEGETTLKRGDRVVVQPTICCDECAACQRGDLNCCDKFGFLGLMGGGGGLSDLVAVDKRFVFKLPDNVPLDVGAMTEPLAVAWHAVEQSGIRRGDDALILGAGPIGLAVLKCLRARGVDRVLVAEVARERKSFASRFGASAVLDPATEDVVARSRTLCGDGQGPAFAFDCAGVARSIASACRAVRSRGTVVNVAVWEGEVGFNFNDIVIGEKKILTALSYTRSDFESVLKALGDGSLVIEEMITRRITMDRVVEDGLKALIDEKDRHVKIVVDVRA